MLAYLIGMIIGEHEENKKIKKKSNNYYYYKNLDIENVENILANARLTQYGKDKYYTEGYPYPEKKATLDDKTNAIFKKLVGRGDLQKHELNHLIDKILENQGREVKHG